MGIENEEIAENIKNYIEAHNSRDFTSLEPDFVSTVGGFGWRNSAWRDHTHETTISSSDLNRIYEAAEYYIIDLDELHTWSQGDIGLAWGVWTESYQWKGGQAEKAKVRFTLTLMKDSDGWHQLMYHRDIQPFDERGIYPVGLTRIE